MAWITALHGGKNVAGSTNLKQKVRPRPSLFAALLPAHSHRRYLTFQSLTPLYSSFIASLHTETGMGGSDAPFLYPPCTPLSQRRTAYPYSNFNPKAATQASYQSLQDSRSPKPRQNGPLIKLDQPSSPYMVVTGDNVNYTPKAYEDLQARKRTRPDGKGPLINFNQHPDSWEIVTGRNVDYKPMPANTKTKVKALRWVQFALRILEEVAAAGLLVCMICFQHMPNVFAWIMRIVVSCNAEEHTERIHTDRPSSPHGISL